MNLFVPIGATHQGTCRHSYSFRYSGDHIVRRQRPPDPLQLELAHWLDLHRILDLRQHARTDEDLPWLGLIAKARGDIRNGPDSGIVESALEADGAERSKAMRNADAEANVMPPPTPRFRQGSDGVTHFKRHEHRLERRVLYRHGIVEDHHHAIASVAFERAVILDDDFADCRMVVAQAGPSHLPRPRSR